MLYVTVSVSVANPKNYFTLSPIQLYRVQYNILQYQLCVMMSSNNPVIQHEVILYNVTLCTNTLFTMLYFQYVSRFQWEKTQHALRVTYSYACTADDNSYKSYASEPYVPVHSVLL